MEKQSPVPAADLPFGTMLRAARLCWYYVPSRDLFIRVSDEGELFLVELSPNILGLLGSYESGRFYRVLDDKISTDALLEMSPVMRNIKRLKRPVSFLLNEKGELAEQAKPSSDPKNYQSKTMRRG